MIAASPRVSYAPESIVYVLRRHEDEVAPVRGTVIRTEGGKVTIDVPAEGGPRTYAAADVYPSEPAAALVLAEEKLATMEAVLTRCKSALETQDKLVADAQREVQNLRRAAAKLAPKPSRKTAKTIRRSPKKTTQKTTQKTKGRTP